MSIYWGMIRFDQGKCDVAIEQIMSSSLSKYPLPKSYIMNEQQCLLGCLSNEYDNIQPIRDISNGLFFVGAAIIDNRDDLIKQLEHAGNKLMSDCELLYQSYLKWHDQCCKFVYGEYSFIIYNAMTKVVECYRDPVGKRCLYYSINSDYMIFSNLLTPIAAVKKYDKSLKVSERYLAEYVAIPEVRHIVTAEITIYEDVYYLNPGTMMRVKNQVIQKHSYWSSFGVLKMKPFGPNEGVKAVKQALETAVISKSGQDKKIGILLSGGLDSSAVGGILAKSQLKLSQRVYSYTTIPSPKFVNWLTKASITDESPYVKDIVEIHPNISPSFINSENSDPISDIDLWLDIMEQPYKFVENSYWIKDCYLAATAQGCDYLFTGSSGNGNISYGDIGDILYEAVMRGHWRRFYHIFKEYTQMNKVGRKKMIKYLLSLGRKQLFTLNLSKHYSDLVNPALVKQYKLKSVFANNGYTHRPLMRFKKMQALYAAPSLLNHYAEAETKNSLYSGVIDRDPTCDVRVVESCLRTPYYEYFYEGRDRGLVRNCFKAYIPESIYLNMSKRGFQGAEAIDKIKPHWQSILKDLDHRIKTSKRMERLYHLPYLRKLMAEHQEITSSFEGVFNMRQIIIVYIIERFLDRHEI